MNVTYFPAEGDYKIFTEDFKFIAEGFNSKTQAQEYIAKNTNEKVYDIYIIWNREFNWCHYAIYLGDKDLEEYKKEILFQGDGDRVKKIKSVLRE